MFMQSFNLKFSLCLFTICIFLLSSCSSTPTKISSDSVNNLSTKSGYVLLGIDIDRYIESILITGNKRIKLSSDDIRARSEKYLLLELPAGRYKFSRVNLTKSSFYRGPSYYELNEGYWNFEIYPKVINYVGHINIVSSNVWLDSYMSIILDNRASQALTYLEDEYPNTLEKLDVRYGGQGSDNFFKLARSLKVQEAGE